MKMWTSVVFLICIAGISIAGPTSLKSKMALAKREVEPMIVEPAASEEIDNEKPIILSDSFDDGKHEVATNAPSRPLIMSTLTLPSNATSIRGDITDGFSCANKSYGYYADVENDCQIFHVCLPVTYADGKETVFRWSFICPEETVFSQDSFTCMRREDMLIDCEESFKYYELNRHFGNTVDESDNTEDKPAVHVQDDEKSPAEVTRDVESESDIIFEQLTSTQKPAYKPTKVTHPSTMMSQEKTEKKPSMDSKPIRRKPGTYPIRKTQLAMATTTEMNKFTITASEKVKPTVLKYPKRPINIAATYPTNEFSSGYKTFNQKHKRPTQINKTDDIATITSIKTTPAIVKEPSIEPIAEVSVVAETPIEKQTITETLSSPAQLNSNLHNEMTDKDSQASESVGYFVYPAATQSEIKDTVPLETQASDAELYVLPSDETEVEVPRSPDRKAPQPVLNETENIVKKPVENIVEETQESLKQEEMSENKTDTSEKESTRTENEIVDEDESINEVPVVVEELEAEKPENAIELVSATPEMEKHDPIVLENFNKTETQKQTMGGFKPVDPIMAAKAEAIISDFLHTLMKTETSNKSQMESIKPMEMAEEMHSEDIKPIKNDVEKTNLPDPVLTMPIEESDAEKLESLPTLEKQDMAVEKDSIMLNNMPSEMYQIPVQVIMEEVPLSPNNQQLPAEIITEEPKTKPMAAVNPLSIDDVVELVKESLDQVPSASTATNAVTQDKEVVPNNSQDQQMSETQRVVSILPIYHRISGIVPDSINEETPLPISISEFLHNSQNGMNTDETKLNPTNVENIENEEIIENKKNSTSIKAEEKNITSTNPRSKRNYKSDKVHASKMDPRKRRFLFKSETSY